jgi:hypothetical protein
MNNDNELKQWFDAHRVDFPDNGFTTQLKHRLPARPSYLPLALVGFAVVTAFAVIVATHGFDPLAANLDELTAVVSHLQPPTFASLVTFLSLPGSILLTGYAIAITE